MWYILFETYTMPNKTLIAYRLSLIAKNFKSFTITVVCSLLIALTLSGCKLVGSNKPAALQVTSTPEASVFLDGKHLGKTPFFSDQLKAGEYTIKISASEASFSQKITLSEGTLTVLNRELNNNYLAQSGETLWLKPEDKGLLIVSMPADSEITIDGKLEGKTPLIIEDIKDDEHKVLLSKEGYAQREFSIKTSGKYQLVADVSLASLAAKGAVEPKTTSVPQVVKVEILKTPQGFLRVRSEPSLSATEIGRVKTQDQLEVIQETKDWIKISFEGPLGSEASKQGWISSQYTKKL